MQHAWAITLIYRRSLKNNQILSKTTLIVTIDNQIIYTLKWPLQTSAFGCSEWIHYLHPLPPVPLLILQTPWLQEDWQSKFGDRKVTNISDKTVNLSSRAREVTEAEVEPEIFLHCAENVKVEKTRRNSYSQAIKKRNLQKTKKCAETVKVGKTLRDSFSQTQVAQNAENNMLRVTACKQIVIFKSLI